MRMAIIADLHSNLQALASIVEEIELARPDLVVCAGDMVGYGANPNECCEIIRKIATHAVLGNHDVSALTRDTTGMNPYAAEASKWTAESLTDKSQEYLGSLEKRSKFMLGKDSVAMYHGSVDSVVDYVYENELREDLLERADADVLILGHTHLPYVAKFHSGIVINPGSVGQPRDWDRRASFAVLDTSEKTCDIHRVEYDVEGAYEAILGHGLPVYLAERLLLGR